MKRGIPLMGMSQTGQQGLDPLQTGLDAEASQGLKIVFYPFKV
jgi:hypothetical protein